MFFSAPIYREQPPAAPLARLWRAPFPLCRPRAQRARSRHTPARPFHWRATAAFNSALPSARALQRRRTTAAALACRRAVAFCRRTAAALSPAQRAKSFI